MAIGIFTHNPFTGQPRHPDDIKSDPYGLLIHDDETVLKSINKEETEKQFKVSDFNEFDQWLVAVELVSNKIINAFNNSTDLQEEEDELVQNLNKILPHVIKFRRMITLMDLRLDNNRRQIDDMRQKIREKLALETKLEMLKSEELISKKDLLFQLPGMQFNSNVEECGADTIFFSIEELIKNAPVITLSKLTGR